MIKTWGLWSNMYFYMYILTLCFEAFMTADFKIQHLKIFKQWVVFKKKLKAISQHETTVSFLYFLKCKVKQLLS